MYAHPVLTAAIADERRRDLIAQADAYRRARGARPGRSRQGLPTRPLSWRAMATAAAGLAITVLLLLAPALWGSAVAGGTYHSPRGVIHHAATNGGTHYSAHGNWFSFGVHWG